jgi:hypothetical protein
MIPDIDIWRVAALMLTRHGDEAMLESAPTRPQTRVGRGPRQGGDLASHH